jgi:hypothetical protein
MVLTCHPQGFLVRLGHWQNDQDNYDKIPYFFEVFLAFKAFSNLHNSPAKVDPVNCRPQSSHVVPRCTAPRHLDCRRLNPAPRSSHPRNSWLPPLIGFRLWIGAIGAKRQHTQKALFFATCATCEWSFDHDFPLEIKTSPWFRWVPEPGHRRVRSPPQWKWPPWIAMKYVMRLLNVNTL